MTTVKICGLKDVGTLASILHLPIDQIGFIFAKSKRQITAEQAGAMTRLIRERRGQGLAVPLAVGVFVNPSMEQLVAVQREAQLDVIQLHGAETPAFCRQVKETLGTRVYRVFSITEISGAASAAIADQLEPYADCIDGLLLDTAGGGTGQTFDWTRIPAYTEWAKTKGIPLLVAGGLTPQTVAELIREYKPDGVDVSSGVETDGVKDTSKITDFVERVKRFGQQTTS
ncbi:MAG: Phosphoribosylanthranilate isomerase [Paenibacillus sp.]|jgi:phosphoribosylanthranilate isomerase|nr:Phosphoribosylanthranilate isomerase [Paenibacillus sp.]